MEQCKIQIKSKPKYYYYKYIKEIFDKLFKMSSFKYERNRSIIVDVIKLLGVYIVEELVSGNIVKLPNKLGEIYLVKKTVQVRPDGSIINKMYRPNTKCLLLFEDNHCTVYRLKLKRNKKSILNRSTTIVMSSYLKRRIREEGKKRILTNIENERNVYFNFNYT